MGDRHTTQLLYDLRKIYRYWEVKLPQESRIAKPVDVVKVAGNIDINHVLAMAEQYKGKCPLASVLTDTLQCPDDQ